MNEVSLRLDLAPFCDPATDLRIRTLDDGRALATFSRGGRGAEIVLQSGGNVEVRKPHGQSFPSLNSLLASPSFANLRLLADTQARVHSARSKSRRHIPVRFRIERGERASQQATREDVLELFRREPGSKMRIVVLDGPAGVGKTHFLDNLELARAVDYNTASGLSPVLCVSTRGRRATALSLLISNKIHELRAAFTDAEAFVLVRRGLLVLAIDGFDELADQDGYKDAWLAFKETLNIIGSSGTIVLAGRDTFFDQQAFYSRLDKRRTDFELIKVRISPPTAEDAKEWLLANDWSKNELEGDVANSVLRGDGEWFLLRPYFLSRLSEYKSFLVFQGQSVRSKFMADMVDREAKIIGRAVGLIDNANSMTRIEAERLDRLKQAIVTLLAEVANDMAGRESNSIEKDYLPFLADTFFRDLGLGEAEFRKLSHRLESVAPLQPDASVAEHVSFPHDEIRHYFFSLEILRSVLQGNVPSPLRRVFLGQDFLEVFADELTTNLHAGAFANGLMRLLDREIVVDRFRENGASLLLTSLAAAPDPIDIRVPELVAREVYLRGFSPIGAILHHATIGRLDARGADLRSVSFGGSTIDVALVDNYTQLGMDVPSMNRIVVHAPELGPVEIRDERKIAKWIVAHSEKAEAGERNPPLRRFLERVCRKLLRQFAIRRNANDSGSHLLDDPQWPVLQGILAKHHRIEESQPSMGGPASTLVRIVNPAAFLTSEKDQDENTKQVIDAIVEVGRGFAELTASRKP